MVLGRSERQRQAVRLSALLSCPIDFKQQDMHDEQPGKKEPLVCSTK